MKSALFVACLCAFGPVALAYQTAVTKGSIEGTVVNPDTGAPMRGTAVTLSASSGQPMRQGQPPRENVSNSVDTDDQGKFLFSDLPPGSYRLQASRRGAQNYSLPANNVVLGEQQQLKGVVLKLATQAVIAGKVLDESGEPVQGAQVSLLRQQYNNGRQQWTNAGGAQTTDLGEYRISVSAPGAYLVSASFRNMMRSSSLNQPLPDKPELAYVPTYYPDVTDLAKAVKVNIGVSGVVGGIDVKVRRAPTVRIRGRVIDPSPTQNRMPSVMLRPRQGYAGMQNGVAMMGMDGEFEIVGVAPGSYTLSAQKYLTEGNTFSASTPMVSAALAIEVGDKQIGGVVLKLAQGKDVPCTVKVEGSSSGTLNYSVTAVPADGWSFGPNPTVRGMDASGFTLRNVPPGQFVVSAMANSANYYAKSVLYGGKEIPADGVELTSGGALEVTFSAEGGRLTGSVVDSAGKPVTRSMVTIVSLGTSVLPPPNTISSPNGEFRSSMLRPGEYRVYAWEGAMNQMAVQTPDLLKAFETYSKLAKVEANGTATVAVTAIPAAEMARIAPGVVQPPEQHTKGSLEGRVVDSKTALPIARATVRIGNGATVRSVAGVGGIVGSFGGSTVGLSTETDEQGHFAFRDVEPGMYPMVAERQGYVGAAFTRGIGGGDDRVVIGEGQQVTGVVLKLATQGVVAGRVLDESAAPVEGARVSIFRRVYQRGQLQFTSAGAASTNDLGEYRIGNLAAGNYIVGVRFSRPASLMTSPFPSGPDMGYPPAYFPNAVEPSQARSVALEAGVQMTGLDISLHKVPQFRVRGKVTSAQGPLPRNYSVVLAPRMGAPRNVLMAPPITTGQDGDFAIVGVPKGSYILMARLQTGPTSVAAIQEIEVIDHNLDGVTLPLIPGREVVATLSMENKTPFTMNGVYANLVSVLDGGSNGGMNVNEGPRITFRGVLPVPYIVAVNNLPYSCNCYVKSIRYGGAEIGEAGAVLTGGGPLEIVISNTASTVEGTVVNRDGKPVPGAAIAIWPSGAMAQVKIGNADDQGRYYWAGNAPGEYKLLAWESADALSLSDPAFLHQSEDSARTVKLDSRAKETVPLTAIPHL